MKHKKILAVAVAIVAAAAPVWAVFNEKDLEQTLSVLRFELREQYRRMEHSRQRMDGRNENQHAQMVEMVKKCNELSLVLYSQSQDYTFDLTYALKEVTDSYEKFSRDTMPYNEMVSSLDIEIERYGKLIESLKRLPPALEEYPDSLKDRFLDGKMTPPPFKVREGEEQNRPFVLDEDGQESRDSCVYYAENLLKMYQRQRERIVRDNEHYSNMSARLKETYDYAQKRYNVVQHRIFFDGQDDYFSVLGSLKSYTKTAFQEAVEKYRRPSGDDDDCTSLEILGHMLEEDDEEVDEDGEHHHHECTEDETEEEHALHEHHHHDHSQWRGPIVLGLIFFVILYLVVASVLSIVLIKVGSHLVRRYRHKREITEDRHGLKQKKLCITLLCGDLIFAATIMIAMCFVHQNFLNLASGLLLVFAWLFAAILFSALVHVKPEQMKSTLKLYTPVIVMGLLVITFRIIFIPNKLVNLVFPPLLLGFSIWQAIVNIRNRTNVRKSDYILSWITLVVLAATTVMSWAGYVLLGVQVFIWWLFQLAAVATVTAVYDILAWYDGKVMERRVARYRKEHKIVNPKRKGAFIEVTWLFDFVKMAVVPVLAILTVPYCIWHASDVFDLTEICMNFFMKPFVNLTDTAGNEVLHLSLYKIVLVSCLYFIFNYINYMLRSFYSHLRYTKAMEQSGNDFVHANEVNLTLAHNIIAILVWGTYIVIAIVALKIPMGAISVVAAGLATGIGLALKDVLNNFIYGIQLMSGRLRVGDYIECDGIRGKVERISYQSTEIVTLDGALMAFTNSTLFAKNFKNLTRNNAYECVKIPVGVAYGADVEQVRGIISKAMEQMKTRDKYNREIVDPARGISVAFSDFGESSVDLVVKQFVIVEEEVAYVAKAKEIIYDALNANGIEIPFPQRDVYIRQMAAPAAQSAEPSGKE